MARGLLGEVREGTRCNNSFLLHSCAVHESLTENKGCSCGDGAMVSAGP